MPQWTPLYPAAARAAGLPVMPPRLLLNLLQPLLAILLLAGLPGSGTVRTAEVSVVRTIAVGSKSLWLHRGRTATSSLERKAEPNRPKGNGASDPVTITPRTFALELDLARLIRVGRACYATAPPRHRPCAAPPTGPPSLA